MFWLGVEEVDTGGGRAILKKVRALEISKSVLRRILGICFHWLTLNLLLFSICFHLTIFGQIKN